MTLVGDLEDIGSGAPSQFERPSRGVRLRARAAAPGAGGQPRSDGVTTEASSVAPDGVGSTPLPPGSQSVYVKTYGCSHNASDSEYMCGLLAEYGYTLLPAGRAAEADLWLINSCTVKNPSQDHLSVDLRRGRELGKRLVVAGCVPQADSSLAKPGGLLDGVSLLGVQQFDRVVEVVQHALEGSTVALLDRPHGSRPSLDLPKVRRNALVEIVPINTGCLGSCSYCKTVHARGRLGSYTPDAIVRRVQAAYAEGVCEVWLTSEDSGAYGKDLGTSLAALFDRLLPLVPEGRMLRLGMTNPPHVLSQLDKVVQV